ncbi:MAG: DUF3560 domain-containing protein [Porticoccaceae bacterium]
MMTATYSPEDNKLRLYSDTRLDAETCTELKAAGFKWAPKQDLWVAPMWTPAREDFLLALCGEIGDEDTSLVDRAEARAERFDTYSDKRAADAAQARDAVSRLADGIPLGQPILVGHHSEKRARKDAKRIEDGMRRAVSMWEASQYWQDRAAGALRHAKYLERPDVRARRIKKLEAEKRKQERGKKQSETIVKLWDNDAAAIKHKDSSEMTFLDRALHITNLYDHTHFCFPLSEYPRELPASQYEGSMSLYSALDDGIITPQQAAALSVPAHKRAIAHYDRWIAHYANRIAYEQAMLAEDGGTVADQNAPRVGGAVQCWASPRGGWSYIQKVNKVTVTVLDNWGNGGRDFKRTIPFDKLARIMSPEDVQAAREAGQLTELGEIGFLLHDSPKPRPVATEATTTGQGTEAEFEAMKETLKVGPVAVVAVPQLFPTPRDIAAQLVAAAGIEEGQTILEPSAGTGNLLEAVPHGKITAVEINAGLAARLREAYPAVTVKQADFLACNGDLGGFDRIIMNPPFENAVDIKHIKHAAHMLKPGGVLVALCANGPRQNEQLRPLASTWEVLPANSFQAAGTGVNVAMLTIRRPPVSVRTVQATLF